MVVKITEKTKEYAVGNKLLEWSSLHQQVNNRCVSNE